MGGKNLGKLYKALETKEKWKKDNKMALRDLKEI